MKKDIKMKIHKKIQEERVIQMEEMRVFPK